MASEFTVVATSDSAEIDFQNERARLRARKYDRVKLCKCHPRSGGHRFGDDLVCGRYGCTTNFHQHLNRTEACRGGLLPPHLRGRKSVAKPEEGQRV